MYNGVINSPLSKDSYLMYSGCGRMSSKQKRLPMKLTATAATIPVEGWERSGSGCNGTFNTVISGIGRTQPNPFVGGKLLDIGCGSGFFTRPLGAMFDEVHGVDVNSDSILEFNQLAPTGFHGHLVSAANMHFADGYFDRIITIETLEHVDDLPATAHEAARVLRRGGELIITVPNRLYPIEGHGGRMFGQEFSRIPFINWFPPIHDRVAKARVFTVASLDRLFVPLGFTRKAVAYMWPTFEHGGGASKIHGHIQRVARNLYPLMRTMETSPLRMFGSSVIVRYERGGQCALDR